VDAVAADPDPEPDPEAEASSGMAGRRELTALSREVTERTALALGGGKSGGHTVGAASAPGPVSGGDVLCGGSMGSVRCDPE